MNRRTFLARIGQVAAAAAVAPYVPWGNLEPIVEPFDAGVTFHGAPFVVTEGVRDGVLYVIRTRDWMPVASITHLRGDPAPPAGDERAPQ